jgi:hypothetical protein
MAITEAERVQIRKYLGFSRLFLQIEPRLESVITTVQSIADGGSAPNNTTELEIRARLADLAALETALKDLWTQAQALDADGLKIDVARAISSLRNEGRRMVGYIADALEISPKRDVFGAKPVMVP